MGPKDRLNIMELFPKLGPQNKGKFDLLSGLIFINTTYEEFRAVGINNPSQHILEGHELPPGTSSLIEVVLHEYFHYLQVSSCGYLYNQQHAIYEAAVRQLTQLPDPGYIQNDPGDLQIGSWKDIVPAFFQEMQTIMSSIRAELGKSPRPSPQHLIEGEAAYFLDGDSKS